jgi:hypothetical protein
VDGGGGGREEMGEGVNACVRVHYGRPNVFKVFEELVGDGRVCVDVDEKEGEKGKGKGKEKEKMVGVVACAPKALLNEVQRQCVLREVDLHMEVFGW